MLVGKLIPEHALSRGRPLELADKEVAEQVD